MFSVGSVYVRRFPSRGTPTQSSGTNWLGKKTCGNRLEVFGLQLESWCHVLNCEKLEINEKKIKIYFSGD